MVLTPATRKFVVHWGELGTRWGINRTVAQIHALLYVSPRPLDAAAIADALSIARSNVSASTRELLAWGIVRTVHIIGDRRDHFEAIADPWEVLRILTDARKRREIDPTLAVLRECCAELAQGGPEERFARKRIESLRDLIASVEGLLNEFLGLPLSVVRGMAGLRGRLHNVLKAKR